MNHCFHTLVWNASIHGFHTRQMNSVGRAVVHHAGLSLVDYEAIAQGMPLPSAAGGPAAAPAGTVESATAMNLAVANVLLNILRQLPPISRPRVRRNGPLAALPQRSPRPQEGADTPCEVTPYDPAAPWMAANCTVFPYSGLENDLEGLVATQVMVWRV